MFLTYHYRVKDKHSAALNSMAQSVNLVWGYCNDVQRNALRWDRRWPSAFDLHKLTAGVTKELGLSSYSINAVCSTYVRSRAKRGPWLRYRGCKSLGWVPMRAPDIRAVDDGFLCMGRRFSIWRSRDLPANAVIKDGSSFSQDAAGHWYLNISISIPDGDAREPERKVGIDLGLKSLATLSTGETVGAPRLYRASEAALAMAQRARKSKRTQRIHAKIANRRKDFLHKLSTRLVQEFDLIAVGNVSPSQLAKTKMAKSIHDAGWGDLRNMIAYKAVRHGARYVEADERNSTRCCSECGSLGGPKGVQHLVIREWQCRDCGAVHDRDTNSALNILRNGLVALIEEPASAREKPKGRIANA